jgi:hypothetical protein
LFSFFSNHTAGFQVNRQFLFFESNIPLTIAAVWLDFCLIYFCFEKATKIAFFAGEMRNIRQIANKIELRFIA